MILAGQRTWLKNRIHATLSKYGLRVEGSSNAFNKKGRRELAKCLELLPEYTRYSAERVREQLDCIERPEEELLTIRGAFRFRYVAWNAA
jgi:hypothetical protein